MNKLAEREGGDRTASRALRFRCTECGAPGTPLPEVYPTPENWPRAIMQRVQCCACDRIGSARSCPKCRAPVTCKEGMSWTIETCTNAACGWRYDAGWD